MYIIKLNNLFQTTFQKSSSERNKDDNATEETKYNGYTQVGLDKCTQKSCGSLGKNCLLFFFFLEKNRNVQTINEGIPDDFQLDLETLRVMNPSKNPGHFACLLVKKVFPELFLSGRKSEYNWFGGGAKEKRELESRFKKTHHQEMCQIFPSRSLGHINVA